MARVRPTRVPVEPFLSWFQKLLEDNAYLFSQERDRSSWNDGGPSGRPSRRAGSVATGFGRDYQTRRWDAYAFDSKAFAVWCGIEHHEYNTLRTYIVRQRNRPGSVKTLSLDVVDRVLTARERADLLMEWYPPKDEMLETAVDSGQGSGDHGLNPLRSGA